MSGKISWASACTTSINPLSPNIHIQILQTDLHTSPLRISWENLIKDHGIFSMMIILLILITLSLDSVWILLGENCCWSLMGIKGLKNLGSGAGPWYNNRELKQRRRRWPGEQQKSNRFIFAKQQLCKCIMLSCTFLCCRCKTTKWISHFVEDRNTTQQLSFLVLNF